VKSTALYALASLVAITVGGWLLSLVYVVPVERRALLVSALLAFVVQVAAFAIAREFARANNAIAGWGLGALISILTLIVYGFVVRHFGLPSGPALLSLASFLFVTELIEPPLLNV